MRVRIVGIAGFADSVAALGEEAEVQATVAEMLFQIRQSPEAAPYVRGGGSRTRVIRTGAHGRCPALRILYFYDPGGGIAYAYFVSAYDELRELLEGTERGLA